MKYKAFLMVVTICILAGIVMANEGLQPDKSTKNKGSDAEKVIARVNGKPIYFSEVEKRIDNFEAKFREINPKLKLPEERKAKMRKDFLDRLIRDKILEEAADKNHIVVTDEEIDQRIEQLKKLFGTGETAQKRFLSGIKDMDEFRKNVAKEVKSQKYFKMKMKDKNLEVSDEDVRKYYDTHQDQFRQEEAVKVRHIFWKLPPKESDDYDKKLEAAKKEAMDVMKKITSGQDFSELAKKFSQDSRTASKGGNIGWITRNRALVSSEIKDIAFKLAVGEVSKPIETASGIYLIQVTEKRNEKIYPFGDIKDKIKKYLKKRKMAQLEKEIYDQLKKQAKIEIYL